MALKARIKDEMKAALLSGDRFVGETLRNLTAAILDEEVKLGKRDEGLSDEEIEKVVAREVKKRNESAKIYRDNNRPDLAEPELAAIIEAKIAELSVTGPQAMGQVIGAVKKQVGNAADGAAIARIVKQKLD